MDRLYPMKFLLRWRSINDHLPIQRTYIIPTRFGFYMSGFLLVLLSMAYIYENNLIYLICFLLTSIVLVAMIQTNYNLNPIDINIALDKNIYANEPAKMNIFIKNKSSKNSYQIEILNTNGSIMLEELGPQERTSIKLPLILPKRGFLKVPNIIYSTVFPLGFFYAWKVYRMPDPVLVFPQKVNFGSHLLHSQTDSNPNFVGHKNYTSSDSLRQLDWKAYARTDQLLVKQFQSDSGENIILDWNQFNILDVEEKLCTLSFLIFQCEKNKLQYQLILPNWKSDHSTGISHQHQCLEKLALYEPLEKK